MSENFLYFSEKLSKFNGVLTYDVLTSNKAYFKTGAYNPEWIGLLNWSNNNDPTFPGNTFSPTLDLVSNFICFDASFSKFNGVLTYDVLTSNKAYFKTGAYNPEFIAVTNWTNNNDPIFPGISAPSNAFVAVNRTNNQLQITLPPQDSLGNFRYGKKDSSKGFITAMTIFFDGPLSLTGTLPTIASHNVTHDSANNALDIYSESNIVLEEGQIYNILESSNVTGTLPQISRIEFGMGIYVDGDDTEYEDELLYTSSSADATAYSIPQYKYHDASLINIYSDGVLV